MKSESNMMNNRVPKSIRILMKEKLIETCFMYNTTVETYRMVFLLYKGIKILIELCDLSTVREAWLLPSKFINGLSLEQFPLLNSPNRYCSQIGRASCR